MPRLDSLGRLRLGKEMLKKAGIEFPSQKDLCYEEGQILICDSENSKNKKVFAFRTIDCQGRISISTEIKNLLDYKEGDFLIVYIQNGNLYFCKKN